MSVEGIVDATIGPYRHGDDLEILAVFRRVFGVDRSLAAWRWAFLENPEGTHIFVARLPSGRIVSQFAGIPRRMKLGGGTACFAEIVDSLTDPEFRQGLKKPGLFASTCNAFVDHFGRADREVIMYGLPNPPAWRVGKALLGYVHLYDVQLMTAPALVADGALPPLPDGGGVLAVPRFSPDVDRLWQRAGQVHEVATIRDARYLNWRYAARPDQRYVMLECRDGGGALFGIAALRHHWLSQPTTAVLELFFDRAHPLVNDAVARVQMLVHDAGDERLQAFVRPGSPEWLGLGGLGWRAEKSHFRFVARTYDPVGANLDRLRDAWYVSLGDFDVA